MRAGDVELNEDVQGVVVEFVGMRGAGPLRLTCKQLRNVATRLAWRRETETVRGRQLRRWRACFPSAVAVCTRRAKDSDLPWLRGVRTLRLRDSPEVTGEGLQHLVGLTSFDAQGRLQHLVGLTSLDAVGCPGIADEGLQYLEGMPSVSLRECLKIMDEGLRHLGSVTTLDLSYCSKITDESLRHLGSVTTLDLTYCGLITDAGCGTWGA